MVAVVLGQTLSGVVLKLHARAGLAIGVESVEGDVVAHAHGAGNLQAMVGGGLVRVQLQHSTERRVGSPCEDVRSGTGGSWSEHRVVDVACEWEVAGVRADVSRAHSQVLGDLT